MINKILETINKYNMLKGTNKIVIGLSGGSDSVTLFHILRKIKDDYNLKLEVVHINHCIRKESIKDEEFCINLCKKYEIPITVYREDIEKLSNNMKITIEEAGRLFRYNCFNKHTTSNLDKIAVAHNKNDVVETFLMRAVRGSGLRGLSSIQPVRDNIIRPLIEIEKKEIEDYCKNNNFQFIFDKSNLSLEYSRNKVRLQLIPLLEKEYNKEVVNNIYKNSQLISEEENFLDEFAKEVFDEITTAKKGKLYLDVEKLNSSNIVIQRRIFRKAIYFLSNDYKHLSFNHIEQCVSLINANNGVSFNLPEGVRVIKEYDKICITQQLEDNIFFLKKVSIDNIYYIEDKNLYIGISKKDFKDYREYKNSNEVVKKIKCLHKKKLSVDSYSNLVLRNRMSSDKIYLKHINGNKKLKKYFIDEKIPRDIRDNIILLAEDNSILLIFDNHLKMSDCCSKKLLLHLKVWEEIK